MPKLKTKSSVKKRFSLTGTGKIRMKASGLRHGMRKRSMSMKRKARHTGIMSAADSRIVSPMMPYAKKG